MTNRTHKDSKMKGDKLKKIFGDRVIMELDSFVRNDVISKFDLKEMAVEKFYFQIEFLFSLLNDDNFTH